MENPREFQLIHSVAVVKIMRCTRTEAALHKFLAEEKKRMTSSSTQNTRRGGQVINSLSTSNSPVDDEPETKRRRQGRDSDMEGPSFAPLDDENEYEDENEPADELSIEYECAVCKLRFEELDAVRGHIKVHGKIAVGSETLYFNAVQVASKRSKVDDTIIVLDEDDDSDDIIVEQPLKKIVPNYNNNTHNTSCKNNNSSNNNNYNNSSNNYNNNTNNNTNNNVDGVGEFQLFDFSASSSTEKEMVTPPAKRRKRFAVNEDADESVLIIEDCDTSIIDEDVELIDFRPSTLRPCSAQSNYSTTSSSRMSTRTSNIPSRSSPPRLVGESPDASTASSPSNSLERIKLLLDKLSPQQRSYLMSTAQSAEFFSQPPPLNLGLQQMSPQTPERLPQTSPQTSPLASSQPSSQTLLKISPQLVMRSPSQPIPQTSQPMHQSMSQSVPQMLQPPSMNLLNQLLQQLPPQQLAQLQLPQQQLNFPPPPGQVFPTLGSQVFNNGQPLTSFLYQAPPQLPQHAPILQHPQMPQNPPNPLMEQVTVQQLSSLISHPSFIVSANAALSPPNDLARAQYLQQSLQRGTFSNSDGANGNIIDPALVFRNTP